MAVYLQLYVVEIYLANKLAYLDKQWRHRLAQVDGTPLHSATRSCAESSLAVSAASAAAARSSVSSDATN